MVFKFVCIALALCAIAGINAVPSLRFLGEEEEAYYASSPNSRVVGGDDADVGEFPHQVSLQREDGSHTCGGSILNENFILTAAHCVVVGNGIEAFPAHYFQVRVGSVQRTVGGELRKIKRIIVNQMYGNFLFDVALLELEEPLVWTANIKPIEMASDEVPSGEDVGISGWGRLYTGGPIPHRLQKNTLSALSTEECQKSLSGIDFIDHTLICLAHEANNGACNGDSGGPATYAGKLVGVAGFVVGGCGNIFPDGYAKVAYHRDWIMENMTPR